MYFTDSEIRSIAQLLNILDRVHDVGFRSRLETLIRNIVETAAAREEN